MYNSQLQRLAEDAKNTGFTAPWLLQSEFIDFNGNNKLTVMQVLLSVSFKCLFSYV
jgi:hypothetical protein